MSITRAIQINHCDLKSQRGWDKTFWFFDIHSTILRPNYKAGNVPKDFYPMAKETLQYLSKLPYVEMVIYTCSHPNEVEEYLQLFEENNIHFKYVNENPEVVTDLKGYGNYDKKPYMNVLFEDKAGFNAETEWVEVYELMFNHYGENI